MQRSADWVRLAETAASFPGLPRPRVFRLLFAAAKKKLISFNDSE